MTQSPATLLESAAAVAALGSCSEEIRSLDDAALQSGLERVATLRRHTDTVGAWFAAELAHRSRREVGYEGLAIRQGFGSVEQLIQSITGSTRQDAVKLVGVGTMLAEAEAAAKLTEQASAEDSTEGLTDSTVADLFPTVGWQAPIATAVSAGTLSLDAAEAIRKALGSIDQAVTAEHLRTAAAALVEEAGTLAGTPSALTTEQLFRRARQLRDELDAEGIARREKERHQLRSVKHWIRPDGMHAGSWLLDPEDGALVTGFFDQLLSPRRGGPRFVDPTAKAAAEELVADERSTEQIAADGLVGIIRCGIDADPNTLLGQRHPAVRVIVHQQDLATHTGAGRIEGSTDTVSIETVQRLVCGTGTIPLAFDDDGQCVNVGRTQRLFTEKQRIGLAVRDGGCRFPGCDRPPAWCEAHHIDHWHRDGGNTDLADGMLVCRRHHLLLHNNHWQITRTGGQYSLTPPATVDPDQTPIPMPPRQPLTDPHREGRERRTG